jgi:hypothetical protein
MRKILITAALLVGFATSAWAQYTIPTFVTQTASGTSTAVTYFATSPLQQIRIVGAIASSDLSSANITFKTGTTPLSITKSNALGTTIDVAYTNGFAVGDFVLLEKLSGVMTNAQIASFTGSTNITFGYNIPQTLVGDQIYKLGTATTLWCGVQTNRNYQGEALFVAQRGRPVQVIVNGTSACSLDSVTARYE